MTLKSEKKEFLIDVVKTILGGIVFSVVVTVILAKVRGQKVEAISWLDSAAIAILGAWIYSLDKIYSTLPAKGILRSYRDLCSRHPEIQGFINAHLRLSILELDTKVNRLADKGEQWEAHERIANAVNLLDDTRQIDCYLATSTDAPYASFDATDSFYRQQRDRLQDADVRRLLVHPLQPMLAAFESDVNRKKAQQFLNLHSPANKNSNSKGGFQLRYFPADSIEDLQREFRNMTLEKDPLVDMAVVGGSLVFGQTAKGPRDFPASGNACVYTGEARAAAYRKAFDAIWGQWKDRSLPPAQLHAWIEVYAMRERVKQKPAAPADPPRTGEAFFEHILQLIRGSSNLRAIDIATSTKDWFEKDEYQQFHHASCEAAKQHPGYHGRIFVLGEALEACIASAFIDNVLKEEVDAGMQVYLLYSSDLVDPDISSLDCIFGESWGFYLTPNDRFDRHSVISDSNWMDKAVIPGYFTQMFNALIQRAHPLHVTPDALKDRLAIQQHLTLRH